MNESAHILFVDSQSRKSVMRSGKAFRTAMGEDGAASSAEAQTAGAG
jgi:hypothetical protein